MKPVKIKVPGLGPVKAEKILKAIDDPFLYSTTVVNEYIKYFGTYYGPIIAHETKQAVQLMCKRHSLYPQYKNQIEHIRKCVYKIPARKEKSGFASIQE